MYIIFLQFIVIIMNLFQDLAEKSNLLIRLQCFDRKLRLNNHIISHFQTDLPPWNFEQLLLGTPDYHARYYFLRNIFVGLYKEFLVIPWSVYLPCFAKIFQED